MHKLTGLNDDEKYAAIYDNVIKFKEFRDQERVIYEGGLEEMWDLTRKRSIQYARYSTDDLGRERFNTKAPYIPATIDAFMAEYTKRNLSYVYSPKVRITNSDTLKLSNDVFNALMFGRYKVKQKMFPSIRDAITVGQTYVQTGYSYRKRQVKMFKDNAWELWKDGNRDIFEKKEIVDYDGIEMTPLAPEDVYFSWDGTDFGVGNGYISKAAVMRYMSLDELKAQLKNNPFAKNLDKMQPQNEIINLGNIFQPIRNNMDYTGMDEVIDYYSQDEDLYVIRAGGQIVLEAPILNSRKRIPITAIKPFPIQYSPWSLGYGAKLLSTSDYYEKLYDAILEGINYSLMDIYATSPASHEQLVDGYLQADGVTFIPLEGGAQSVERLDKSTLPIGEVSKVLADFDKEATLKTGVDQRAMGFNVKSATATDAALNKEATTAMLDLPFQQIQMALNDIGELAYIGIKDFMAIPDELAEAMEERETLDRSRIVPLNDIEVVKRKGGEYMVQKKKGNSASVSLTKSLFSFDMDQIEIRAEGVPAMSKGMQMKKAEEMFALSAPFAGDPMQPTQPGQPKPYINMADLLRFTYEAHDYPTDLLIDRSGTVDEAIKRAYIQIDALKRGEIVEPIPGEPEAHLEIQAKAIAIGKGKLEELAQTAESVEELQVLTEFLDKLIAHHQVDMQMPAELITQEAQEGQDNMGMQEQQIQGPADMVESTINPGEGIEDMMNQGRPNMMENPMQQGTAMPGMENIISGNSRVQSEDIGGALPPENFTA